jgi:hypothetical protein
LRLPDASGPSGDVRAAVLIPAYQCAATIAPVVSDARAHLTPVVVVDPDSFHHTSSPFVGGVIAGRGITSVGGWQRRLGR